MTNNVKLIALGVAVCPTGVGVGSNPDWPIPNMPNANISLARAPRIMGASGKLLILPGTVRRPVTC